MQLQLPHFLFNAETEDIKNKLIYYKIIIYENLRILLREHFISIFNSLEAGFIVATL